jgi:hypothetical protein
MEEFTIHRIINIIIYIHKNTKILKNYKYSQLMYYKRLLNLEFEYIKNFHHILFSIY